MCTASSAARTCGALASASLYTATARTPSSRHARMMRSAISPRLAMRTLANMQGCHVAGGWWQVNEEGRCAHGTDSPCQPGTSPCHLQLQRNIPMLFWRIPVALGLQRLERVDEARTGVARIDDVIQKATARRHIWVRELLAVLADLRIGCPFRVFALGDFLSEQDLDRA